MDKLDTSRLINSSFNFLPAPLRAFLLVVTCDAPDPEPLQQGSFLTDVQLELCRKLSLRIQNFATVSDTGRLNLNLISDPYKKIGAGACGAILAQEGRPFIVKVAKTDDEQLWNDFTMHAAIAEQFRSWSFSEVRIPACYGFVPPRDPYFDKNPALVEAAKQVCNLPKSALVADRIFPLPLMTRNLLIENYCPMQGREAARNDAGNRDCLVRVYLGSMQGRQGNYFSLRNFKLHLNQMVELHLDVKTMAGRVAVALAVMHWAAKTDARDVEFVLGSSSQKISEDLTGQEIGSLRWPTYTGPSSYIREDFFTRTTDLWLLDFNQVQPITMDEDGVAKAVEAIRLNDPYFPRPLQQSRMEIILWNEFVAQYLAAAHKILRHETNDQTILSLPAMFIDGLINLEMNKQQNKK
ncbi:zinc finger domain-containing protein [Trichoderma evansii]